MAKPASLTGSWSGAYRYARGGNEQVFNAQIEEIAGTFTGTIQEPNTFGEATTSVLTSDIDGTHNGASVSFLKFYDGSGAQHHAVRYEGTVDGALTRIDGAWTIPGVWSGTFFMTRDDDGDAAEAEERAETTIDRKL